jgi:hypothetical protein
MEFYIGMPYSLRLFNCWDYVAKVRADNNIKTKLFKPKNLANAFEMITAEMKKIDNGLTRVDKLKDLDIVIAHKNMGSRPLYHCGIYYQGSVAHCCRTAKQVIFQPYDEFMEVFDGVTMWR